MESQGRCRWNGEQSQESGAKKAAPAWTNVCRIALSNLGGPEPRRTSPLDFSNDGRFERQPIGAPRDAIDRLSKSSAGRGRRWGGPTTECEAPSYLWNASVTSFTTGVCAALVVVSCTVNWKYRDDPESAAPEVGIVVNAVHVWSGAAVVPVR